MLIALLIAATNLLPNPSLEEVSGRFPSAWRTDFWEPYGVPRARGCVTTNEAHSGRFSLQMSGMHPGSQVYLNRREFPARPGRHYVFSAWTKLDTAAAPDGCLRIQMAFKDVAGNRIVPPGSDAYHGSVWRDFSGKTADWVRIGVGFDAPSNAAAYSVTVRLVGVGTAWVDDLELTDEAGVGVPSPAPGAIAPGFVREEPKASDHPVARLAATGRLGLVDEPVGGKSSGFKGVLTRRKGTWEFYDRERPAELDASTEKFAILFQRAGGPSEEEPISLDWELLDYFCRRTSGRLSVPAVPEGRYHLTAAVLEPAAIVRLRRTLEEGRGDRFRIAARGWRDEFRLAFHEGTRTSSPLSPRGFRDLPVFGRVELVDEVVCATDKDHAMRQGAKGFGSKTSSEPLGYYGGSDRLNYDWIADYRDSRETFSSIRTILGRGCRVADDWAWFAYRMGGGLRTDRYYVLEIEYPEDDSRNMLVSNQLNPRADIGFHTGSALGDPHTRQRFMQKTDLPLSGRFACHRTVFRARRAAGWIGIHSTGRKADPFSRGAAVHAIRIYELGGVEALERLKLPATEPEGLPHRTLGYANEDYMPEPDDLASAAYAGLNAFAPIALLYCGGRYSTGGGEIRWRSRLFDNRTALNPMARKVPEYYNCRGGVLEPFFARANKLGLRLYPIFEYGGTGQLPPEAFARDEKGQPIGYSWGVRPDKDGVRRRHYVSEGLSIDMGHPAVGEDMKALVREFAGIYGRDPAFGGMLFAVRYQCWQLNAGDDRNTHYERKRRNFLMARDALVEARSDAVLGIMNYNGGDDNLHFGSPLFYWGRKTGDEFLRPGEVSLPDLSKVDLVHQMEDWTRVDVAPLSVGMNPRLYREDCNLWVLPPVHYPWLAGNADYLNAFRTAAGSALLMWWVYNEDSAHNHLETQWDAPGLHGNEPAGRFSMLDEVLAMATADPVAMFVRIGSFNRGFPEYARAFAAAYRALPAVRSVVQEVLGNPQGVVIRRYGTGRGTYYAVVDTRLSAERTTCRIPATGANSLVNLVTREVLEPVQGTFLIETDPVSLQAWRECPINPRDAGRDPKPAVVD